MSDVTKRCGCDPAKQNKCGDPWYMKKFIYQGKAYADNVTRWAAINLPTVDATTRTKADEVVELMRTQIRTGVYQSAKAAAKARPKADTDMTLTQLVAAFDRDVLSLGVVDEDATSDETLDNHRARLQRLADFDNNGARPARDCDAAAVVAFRASPTMRKQGRSSWGKYLGIYNRLFRYAKRAGVISVHPFEDASEEQKAVLKRRRGEPRTRRLKAGEEDRLLRAAAVGRFAYDSQRLIDLIVAALESAGRFGEIMALRWADVVLATAPAIGVLTITGTEKGAGKTGKRTVPISDRLDEVLRRRRINRLTGQPFPETAYVFGNEVGERVTQIRSWRACVVRAQGVTPTLTKGNLSAASLVVYKAAALHFHDLRREAASRWLESHTFNLKVISKLLGHSNIAQTSTYLEVADGSAIDAMREYNAQRKRQQAEAEALPIAVGANDYKPTTNEKPAGEKARGPRLVKGNNRNGNNDL